MTDRVAKSPELGALLAALARLRATCWFQLVVFDLLRRDPWRGSVCS
jgi:hypothetical protein